MQPETKLSETNENIPPFMLLRREQEGLSPLVKSIIGKIDNVI
jgi:hypothetical protein